MILSPPNPPYGAFLADPPWNFETWGERGTGRGAFSHYDLMTLEELKQIAVESWAAKDSMLFLWVVAPHLDQGLELLAAWGFRFKTVS